MFAFISPVRLDRLIANQNLKDSYFVLSFCLATRRCMNLASSFLRYANRSVPRDTRSLTVSRRSVTQGEKATNVFSPFLVVGSKTSLQKCFADLSDTPSL